MQASTTPRDSFAYQTEPPPSLMHAVLQGANQGLRPAYARLPRFAFPLPANASLESKLCNQVSLVTASTAHLNTDNMPSLLRPGARERIAD
jgi:hypothetical protein